MSPRLRVLVRMLAVGSVLAMGAGVLELANTGLDGAGTFEDVRHLTVCAFAIGLVLCRVRAVSVDRPVWVVFAGAMTLIAIGDGIWAVGFGDAALSPADLFYASSYIAFFTGLGIYLRRRVADSFLTFWLDSLGISTYLVAVTSAVLLPAIIAHGTGAFSGTLNLFYPCADAAIVSVVLAVASMTGRRMHRQDGLFAASFVATMLADAAYALSLAGVLPDIGGGLDLIWEAGFLLLGMAAWGAPTTAGALRVGGWWEVAPTLSWLAAGAGVLVVGQITYVHPVAIGFATAAISAAAVRVTLITREVRQLVRFRQEALTDELTGLPNRRGLFRELDLLAQNGELASEHAALLSIDLDGFKELNNALGHAAGDLLLRALGARLEALTPGVLARDSGDGFAALVSGPDRARALARTLLDGLEEPIDINGVTISVTASIGIARFPADTQEGADLARCAQVALADAKRLGLPISDYNPAHDDQSVGRLELAADLRDALHREAGLWLAFQPQVSFATGAVVGAEALIRWEHSTVGNIPPDVLLPVAERTGLMPELTDWVLDRALTAAAEWQAGGHVLTVSVNVSASTLIDAQLPDRVGVALARHGVAPSQLVIEVTEQAVMTDSQRCGDVLAELGEMGLEIAIDDFGTGNSSLVQLREISSSELKVDKSFVMRMASDPVDREIVAAVVTMARRLGRRVVAEGIEVAATWQALAALDCDVAQGYGIGRPMPASEFSRYLAAPPDLFTELGTTLRAA